MQLLRIVAIFSMLLTVSVQEDYRVKVKNSASDYLVRFILDYHKTDVNSTLKPRSSCPAVHYSRRRYRSCWLSKCSNDFEYIDRYYTEIEFQVWARPLDSEESFKVFEEFYLKPRNRCMEFEGSSTNITWKEIPCDQ